MSNFDFTALVKFLQMLFDAFVALIEKLGFELPGTSNPEGGEGDEGEATE